MSEQPDGRPQWRDIALTAFPPVTLVVALLVYYAWVRRDAYAEQLGFDPGLLGETSIAGYLLRSVKAVWFPLVVALSGVLVWLLADRILRRWIADGTRVPALFCVRWALYGAAVALAASAELVPIIAPASGPYVDVAWPFLIALAVLALAYGRSLRGLTVRQRGARDSVGHRWAITTVTGILVALLLFDGMEGFAQVVGRGLAMRIITQPTGHTQPVLLYSARDLQLSPSTATTQPLPGTADPAYRYCYQGLRLVTVGGGNYFLIGRNWRSAGPLIVLPQDGIRVEFLRNAATSRDIG